MHLSAFSNVDNVFPLNQISKQIEECDKVCKLGTDKEFSSLSLYMIHFCFGFFELHQQVIMLFELLNQPNDIIGQIFTPLIFWTQNSVIDKVFFGVLQFGKDSTLVYHYLFVFEIDEGSIEVK